MATRTTKILGFSVPPAIAREVEELARKERKTKSELFREMVGFYRQYSPIADSLELAWIEQIIQEAKRAPKRSEQEEIREFRRLQRAWKKAAEKQGIKTEADIDQLVYEFR